MQGLRIFGSISWTAARRNSRPRHQKRRDCVYVLAITISGLTLSGGGPTTNCLVYMLTTHADIINPDLLAFIKG